MTEIHRLYEATGSEYLAQLVFVLSLIVGPTAITLLPPLIVHLFRRSRRVTRNASPRSRPAD